MGRLAGKVAIVTGGGSGIGAETAILMASEGAQVAVAGRTVVNLQNVVKVISERGGEAFPVAVDLEQEDSIRAMVEAVAAHYGKIDVLAANAALTDPAVMTRDGMAASMDADVWDKTLRVNLRGAMLCSKHVIPHLLKSGGGAIVYSGSGKGLQGDFDHMAYGTSKAGLINMMRYVATQYGKQGIRANVAVIGLVMTEALRRGLPEAMRNMIEEHHLTPFIGDPKDVAEVIAFLASDAARFITGAAIPVDGGVTAHAPMYADMMRMRQQRPDG